MAGRGPAICPVVARSIIVLALRSDIITVKRIYETGNRNHPYFLIAMGGAGRRVLGVVVV